MATAVLFSYTALEGLGNHTIEQLDADASLEIGRNGRKVVLSLDCMERALSVSQKLSEAVPLFTGEPSLKGSALWARLVRRRR